MQNKTIIAERVWKHKDYYAIYREGEMIAGLNRKLVKELYQDKGYIVIWK